MNFAQIAVDALAKNDVALGHAADIARVLRKLDAQGMLARQRTPELVAERIALGIKSGIPHDPFSFRPQKAYDARAQYAVKKFGLLDERTDEIARRLYELEVDGFVLTDEELDIATANIAGAMLEGRAIVNEFILA